MVRRGAIFGIVASVIIATSWFGHHWWQRQSGFLIAFLDIGQGDSIFIRFENGETMLVDCGANRKVLSELGKVLPFYRRSIDYLVATHPDLDHYGGCVDVLRRYQVKHIVTNGRSKGDSYWQTWDRLAHLEGAEIITMASPTIWHIGHSDLAFLSPDPSFKLNTKAGDSNNYSVVFRVTNSKGKTFLLTGDMETPLEQALLRKYCYSSASSSISCPSLRADVLKVGHHGSDSSSSEIFLQTIGAKQAVISVGKNNPFGHPSLRVLRHLERAGAAILRTDELGAILMQ